jgi:hypothetical protein
MRQEEKITTQDLKEFLRAFMRPQDYDRLTLALKSKKEFCLPFKLIEKINHVQYVIISNKNNNFSVRFIPDEIASAHCSSVSELADLVPDVIVFVDK